MLIEKLEQEFAKRKGRNPSYSFRAFANSLDFNPGALSDIVNKKRPLTFKSAQRLARGLPMDLLKRQEILSSFLEDKPETKEDYFDISELTEEVVGDWRYFAILSILQTKKSQDSASIAERLGLKKQEVQGLMQVLIKLGLIQSSHNRYSTTHKNLTSTHEIPSLVLRKAHRQWIEMALRSLDVEDIEKRDITGITMAIDPGKLKQAKAMITDFRRRLCKYLESENQQDVYRLNIQLFSLEKKRK